MRLDVSEHKGLIKKFKKVLIKVYGNDRLAVVAKFYGEGVKELKYATQIEVIGGTKKSQLILKSWADYKILDEIEKRPSSVSKVVIEFSIFNCFNCFLMAT